jgi:hypothetical protein
MSTTYNQTVEIWLPGEPEAPIRYDTSLAPVGPPETTAIEKADGTRIFWTPRYTYSLHPSGLCFTWYTKPTLATAVANLATNRSYYEFNKDNTVSHRFIDFYKNQPVELHWSAPLEASLEIGTDISASEGFGPYYEGEHPYTAVTNDYVEDVCEICNTNCDRCQEVSCFTCGTDCDGSDYYKEGFCSRWCMRDYYRH